MRWTSSARMQWTRDLHVVLPLCFSRSENCVEVQLVFSTRRLPGIFAMCDPASGSIGIFPLARKLGPLQRLETLVHECCHLTATGLHTRGWKRAMGAAAEDARRARRARLAKMIEDDVGLYERREVSAADVERQMLLIMRYLSDVSFNAVQQHLADWAGWPVKAFATRFPWLRKAWRSHSSTAKNDNAVRSSRLLT